MEGDSPAFTTTSLSIVLLCSITKFAKESIGFLLHK